MGGAHRWIWSQRLCRNPFARMISRTLEQPPLPRPPPAAPSSTHTGCSTGSCFDCCFKAGVPCSAHAKQLDRKRLETKLLAAGPSQSQLKEERRRLAKGVFKEEAIHGETQRGAGRERGGGEGGGVYFLRSIMHGRRHKSIDQSLSHPDNDKTSGDWGGEGEGRDGG